MHLHTLRLALWRTAVCAVAIVTISWTAQPVVTHALEEAEASSSTVVETAQSTEPTTSEATNTSPEATPKTTTIPATIAVPEALSSTSDQTPTTTQSDTSEVASHNTITNTISSDATSGNATGSTNTEVGAITTGNAAATATLINTLLANVSLGNGSAPIFFTYNVHGTVNKDLLIDPEVLASNAPSTGSGSINPDPVALSAESHATITNNLDVSAASGTATAHQNTTAGDVASGTATALVNAINIINSSVAADQSFIGMINIYGDLQGDILLPYGFVSQILAAHSAANNPQSQSSITSTATNATVVNNINASAASGNTNVDANTITGTITTGGATTNVTILDLTTQEIVGTNALLVFINVMGSWIGLLLDAPGTTSAMLGDGGGTTNDSTNASLSSELTIENNINVSAQSGNANATENTTVGNVHTGSAHAGVNLLNIINSSVSLSNWFGVLFINVFGNWTGDFAIAPEATEQPEVTEPTDSTPAPAPAPNNPLISFVPRGTSVNTRIASVLGNNSTATEPETASPAAVQSDSVENTAATPLQLETAEEGSSSNTAFWLAAGGAILLALLGFALFRRLQQRNIN